MCPFLLRDAISNNHFCVNVPILATLSPPDVHCDAGGVGCWCIDGHLCSPHYSFYILAHPLQGELATIFTCTAH